MIRLGLALIALSLSGVVLFEGGRRVPESDLLRGYAVSRCLSAAYAGQPMEQEANRNAEAYREAGNETRTWVYGELDRLAREAAATIPPSLPTGSLSIMRCVEFYESRDVRSVASGRRPTSPARSNSPGTHKSANTITHVPE